MKIKYPITVEIENDSDLKRFLSLKGSEMEVGKMGSIAFITVKEPLLSSEKPLKKTNRKITIDQINKIKDMAERNISSKQIAKVVGISEQLVNYWRKNTQKEINGER